jgi:hypothetical protein
VRINPVLVEAARKMGLPLVKLVYMANHAVPYNKTPNAKRYKDMLFHVSRGEIVQISAVPKKPVYQMISVICPDCSADGDFCLTCNTTGYVKRRILIDPVTGMEVESEEQVEGIVSADRVHHGRTVHGSRTNGTAGRPDH